MAVADKQCRNPSDIRERRQGGKPGATAPGGNPLAAGSQHRAVADKQCPNRSAERSESAYRRGRNGAPRQRGAGARQGQPLRTRTPPIGEGTKDEAE